MQTHMMNQSDPLAELLVAMNARKAQEMGDLFVLVSQCVCAELFRTKIAAEMFFTFLKEKQNKDFRIVRNS